MLRPTLPKLADFVPRSAQETARPGVRQRGQALVLFVIMAVVMVGGVAIVTDVSWLWYGQQRMQRAADAAALAGAIYLPGDASGAYSTARAEAAKNGFTNGANGVLVTPLQDPKNRRRLIVTISGPVSSYFARVFGVAKFSAAVTSRAEYVLPVPMGSPQVYYGVGDYMHSTTTSNTTSGDTNFLDPSASAAQNPGGSWTPPSPAYTWNDNKFATTSYRQRCLPAQQLRAWRRPSRPARPSTASSSSTKARSRQAPGCQLKFEISWNAAGTWSTAITGPDMPTSNTVQPTLGNALNTSPWGGHAWVQGDLSDANFRVRVTYVKPAGCGTLSLDGVRVDVTYHKTTTTTTTTTSPVIAPDGSSLASQGFWGAVITKGGERQNGDQFDPFNDSLNGRNNPDYDPNAIDYTVIIKGGNGRVKLFDPTFCAMGSNGSGGYMGAGDHWIGGSTNPVTTKYELWNENNTPYSFTDDTLVATTGSTFAGEVQADYSQTAFGNPPGGLTDCSGAAYHNSWYSLASGLAPGTYRLNVSTNAAGNNSTNAENMWSIWVSSDAQPRVYGEGRMVAYNNLVGGIQQFYLAQIDAVHAGKTMRILLFDPGDVSGNAFLRILSPNGNNYNYATFSYTADNGRSGNNVTQIQTANAGGSYYNDSLITIDIPLPSNYGAGGLKPPGETEDGWWKIEYQVNGGNDTTTWQVSIRGSPVHLVQ